MFTKRSLIKPKPNKGLSKVKQQCCDHLMNSLIFAIWGRKPTCPGEEVVAVLVEGHSHDAVGQVKGFLHAVSMVNVDVYVEHPGVVPTKRAYRHKVKTPAQ